MSNREYKSDMQKGFDKQSHGKYNPGQSEVIGKKSHIQTSVSKGLSFCPSCGAMMLPTRDGYKCNSCGYVSDGSTDTASRIPTKSKTYLELNVKKHDLKINSSLLVSGYLRLKNDYILINAEIEIYFSGQFLKYTFTDEEGYYQFTFPVKKIGKQEVMVVYRGDSEYEMSTSVDYVNVTNTKVNVSVKSNHDDDFITKLEKLVDLYERGLLTDEEFSELKRKLIS